MLHTCEDATLLNSHNPPRLLVIRRWSGEVTVELVVVVVLLLAEEKKRTTVSADWEQSVAAEELVASPYAVAHRRVRLVERPGHRWRTFLLVTGSLELQLAGHDGHPRTRRDALWDRRGD